MKTVLPLLCAFSLLPLAAPAQVAAPPSSSSSGGAPSDASSPFISDRGPHHREWSRVTWDTNRHGKVVAVTNSAYTELATGLHYRDPATGAWIESQPHFEITPQGYAVARRGQHQIILSPNINATNAVDTLMPDGRRLISRPWGLVFHDRASASNVLIATLKDCTGQWVSSNVVFYPNAFDGLKAGLRFSNRLDGWEQDVVLYENPGSPSQYGLNPATTALESWTEMFTANAPRMSTVSAGDGETEDRIEFPAMSLGQGQAYFLSLANHDEPSLPVRKYWRQIAGRTFLIEAVRYSTSKPLLDRLVAAPPDSDSRFARKPVSSREAVLAQFSREAVPAPKLVASITPGRMGPEPAVVLDYTTLNTSQANYTFRGDLTYYINGTVNLSGTTTIEGGTVVEFTNTVSAKLNVTGTLNCRTGPYRPAIFTAKDDNTVGETIGGSTGSPSGYYGYMLVPSSTVALNDCRFSFANRAIYGNDLNLTNVQFVNCSTPIYCHSGDTIIVDNGLFCTNGVVAGGGRGAVFIGQHLTVDQSGEFYGPHDCTIYVTNSILVGLSGWGDLDYGLFTNEVAWLPAGASVFQPVGAGSYYLTSDSPYRNAGVTSITPALLANLRLRTTYPPLVSSNTFASDTTLTPQVQRDTDLPDLGYHYDPIDYFANPYIGITNATLAVSNGAVIGTVNSAGIWLQDNSTIVSVGTPRAPNWFVRYYCVQEQPIVLGTTAYNSAMDVEAYSAGTGTTFPQGEFRFTQFACLAGGGYHIYHYLPQFSYSSLLLQDCGFWSGYNYLGGYTNTAAKVRNTLFKRSKLTASTGGSGFLSLSNNLVSGISVTLMRTASSRIEAHDNAFDNCTITSLQVSNSHNGYINCSATLNPAGPNNVVVTNFTYASGPLGDFYQSSTNFLDVGSVSDAALAGLYHYTTTTNQAKEANSALDIGFHYVAVDANANPLDGDADGFPDYWEDRTGDGVYGTGDPSSWTVYNSPSGLVSGSGLQVFTPLK